MEKRVLGIVLSALGILGLIYAGVSYINAGAAGRDFRVLIAAGGLGLIFFLGGITLVMNTKDKPT